MLAYNSPAMKPHRLVIPLVLLGVLALWACAPDAPTPTQEIVTPAPPTQAPATALPSPTSEPPAARVNGESITMESLAFEILAFEKAQAELGIDLATLPDYKDTVLQAMIDRLLLAQGAQQQGVQISPAELVEKLQQVAEQMGGDAALEAWLGMTGYSLEGLQAALREDMLAAEMIASLVSEVPSEEEQVHARHILVGNKSEADQLRQLLSAGADFTALVETYSQDLGTRSFGGDLGWFPTGFLSVVEVEQAAFALQPGELSPVVESVLGFHIVETLERGVHPLSPEAMRLRREEAVENWLARQREVAQTEVFASP